MRHSPYLHKRRAFFETFHSNKHREEGYVYNDPLYDSHNTRIMLVTAETDASLIVATAEVKKKEHFARVCSVRPRSIGQMSLVFKEKKKEAEEEGKEEEEKERKEGKRKKKHAQLTR